ncbi:MAG: NAD+ synthase [Candidatus Omnitrophota bacterium]|nr:MAG: NAD+ synthase [Candidatus Omnitrophota bacterium]RKY37219.1 MAG: NAD+ synthase [Candidatus Omnitrophota bacterium]RKY46150.1 MAG: NAD+ synthase [Candidatus Omnitrophota bacterium]HDN85739.1 NAD+ synthase [Candidatus Omnitrophota bacterium]
MLKIGLAQINPCVGDFQGNFSKILRYIDRARKKRVDIIVFGELALCGYPPEDLLLKPQFIEENIRYINRLKSYTKKIKVILGFVDKKDDRIFNAYAFFDDGKLKDIYHKIYLPNYGVFDEKRYFSPGEEISFYSLEDYGFSVNICEDIWQKDYLGRLSKKKLDFIINLAASPYHLGKISLRKSILSRASQHLNCFLFYCNIVGGQDELVFDGTSMVVSPSGKVVKFAKRFKEDLLIFNFNKNKRLAGQQLSVSCVEEVFEALKLGLFDYVKKNGFKKVIVGVSGGIDSAVVVSLATLTLGKKNVFGLIMPSQYTSSQTFDDAKRICKNLGIKFYTVSIKDIFDAYLSTLKPFFKNKPFDKSEENIQARVRGNLLMAFSNKFGYLVLNTGNKSEVSCGYCTLYGDMVGGFGVLKDVPKTMVYKIARYINRTCKKEVIPSSVFRRPPSAELKPNQKDSDILPPYSLLDPILKLYIEENLPFKEIVERGFNKDLVKKVIRMVDANEYKRRQSPIGIKITSCAFGKDRRMPIVNKFLSKFIT